MKRAITLILPHYMNLGMLAEQQAIWASYPPELKAHLHVVVVDDCSPKDQQPDEGSVSVKDLASFQLYRLTEKIRWNWLACRNLGAKVATTDWLLLTDMDHAIPEATLRTLLTWDFDYDRAYRFRRVTATQRWPYDVAALPPWKPHNDSWFLSRWLFFHDRVFGYDERLSGCYGTSSEFTGRLRKICPHPVALSDPLVRYPRELIADASTTVYTRKGDPVNQEDLKQRKAERELIPNWKPLHGLTPYQLIYGYGHLRT